MAVAGTGLLPVAGTGLLVVAGTGLLVVAGPGVLVVAGPGLLVVARAGLLVLGVATTVVAVRAYRRHRTRYLRDAAVGFGIVTAGVLAEGVLYQFTDLALADVHLVETVAIGLGFVVLLRSFLQ